MTQEVSIAQIEGEAASFAAPAHTQEVSAAQLVEASGAGASVGEAQAAPQAPPPSNVTQPIAAADIAAANAEDAQLAAQGKATEDVSEGPSPSPPSPPSPPPPPMTDPPQAAPTEPPPHSAAAPATSPTGVPAPSISMSPSAAPPNGANGAEHTEAPAPSGASDAQPTEPQRE